MGIPSYYRKLLVAHPHLVRKASVPIDWLWMDYNCLIYHCLRLPGIKPYPGIEGQTVWETELLRHIVVYTQKVVAEVNPTKGVYIGIDGVVPMAKMRQQRLRRFKSSTVVSDAPSWDTNAITPGTAFMTALRIALEKNRKSSWIISSSDEPGEGEHKVMAHMKRTAFNGCNGVVYGLDADLIVLSLLTQDTLFKTGITVNLHLFREQQLNTSVADLYDWFSIGGLRDILSLRTPIRDYCCAMSFLGNDFLPSSLGFKMRYDGHDRLLDILGIHTVLKEDEVDPMAFLRVLATDEARRTEDFIQKKMKQCSTHLEVGEENWPLSVQEEKCLMNGTKLREDWVRVYHRTFLYGMKESIRIYHEGLRWIWNYYRGKDVCYNWYYPLTMPPLWNDLINASGNIKAPSIRLRATDILTAEQLCLVLPPKSWHLIQSEKHRQLMTKAPYLFPKEFGFSSVGKRFFWECEPEIPIPSICEVKALLT